MATTGPGISGELLYRTHDFVTSKLIPPLPPQLHSFLVNTRHTYDSQLRLLSSARKANRRRRRQQISVRESQLHEAELHNSSSSPSSSSSSSTVEARLLSLLQKEAHRSSSLDNLVTLLQRRLTTLSLLYYAIVRHEKSLVSRRLSYEASLVTQMEERMKLTERLGLLSLHIQHETRGGVVVKKLKESHPQYLRCQRAATENVKKDFFAASPSSRYSGVSVESVWKIENRILLDTFQSAASTSDPGKVKGLFCGVPADCLETLIVYGMSGRPREGSQLKHAFQDTWYDIHSRDVAANGSAKGRAMPSTIDAGKGRRAVDAGTAIPFPRCFSRHSTLEEDRELVKGEEEEEKKGGGRAEKADGLDSGVRFLALCRVMIGKILVTAKNSSGFPPVTDGSYDSMYSPMQEEYKLLNSSYVLPEFLVQYRFTGKQVDIDLGSGDGFDVDLSTPEIQVPKFDAKSEARGAGGGGQFPMGWEDHRGKGTERGGFGGVGGGEGGENGGQARSSAPRAPSTSAAYTDDNAFLAQRQNASKQKEAVIEQAERLFGQCHKGFAELKVTTMFQPLNDDGGDGGNEE